MKNLKKLSALAISIMMVLSFAGCEDSKDSSKEDSSSKAETTTTTTSATESSSDVDSGSSSNTETGLKDGVYTTEDYSIELGDGWEESSSSVSGITIFKLSDDTTTNINILKENVGKEVTAEEYKDAAAAQFEAMEDYTITDSESATINGKDAYKVYLTAKSSSIEMNLIQGYIVDDTNVYVFTFTTLADSYKELEPTAQKILESFKVL